MRKKFLIVFLVGVALLVGFVGFRSYKLNKQDHLIKLARDYMGKGDTRNALLCAQQVVSSNPNHLEASRMIADLAERAGAPQAIYWRSRVVELDPEPITNRLSWAMTALGLGDLALAQKAIDSVRTEDRKTAQFHRTAGAVAAAAKQYTNAVAHFAEATKLDPADPTSKLSLAVLRLHDADPQVSADGRNAIEQLRTNPLVRRDSLRELEANALQRGKMDDALALSRELLMETNVFFRDRLVHLTILRNLQNPEQEKFLAALQGEAHDDPLKAFELGRWMIASAQAQKALVWIQTLPPNLVTNQPVPVLQAECHLALHDWPGLLAALDGKDWRDLDCLRLIYRVYAFKAQKLEAATKAEWHQAMEATQQRLDRLALILRTITPWDWPAEKEEILWTIVNRFPSETWALSVLAERFHSTGQTQSLLKLFSQAADKDPKNSTLKNNVAMAALLLNASERKPHDLAQEVYDKDPQNPNFASTYAYSLYLQQKTVEALRVFGQFNAQQLEDPNVAMYYGIVLKASGDSSRAKRYLDLAAQGRLLPEEKALVRQARGVN